MARFILIVVLVLISSLYSSGKEMRHYRHVDGKSRFVRQTNDYDNHAPQFLNCSMYAPEINEGEPPGTEVIQVQAVDYDPPEKGGTITYSLAYEPDVPRKFEIDATTGLIRTIKEFDRDKPKKEEEEHLTVFGTDNGRQNLEDFCAFKVTIKDVNDNPPVFNQRYYKDESVPQDLPVDQMVTGVLATDIDDGENSVVVYSLSPSTAKEQQDSPYFRIDNRTGDIFLTKEIDKNLGYKFHLYVRAQDLGDDLKYDSAVVDILVVESYKKAPSFLTWPHEPIRLKENFSDRDAIIAKLEADSNVPDDDRLTFEFAIRSTQQTNGSDIFRLELKENVAYIKLKRSLDYETDTEYTLTVHIRNLYGRTAETEIKIEVLDVNDETPKFPDFGKNGTVAENKPPGVRVMQVQAIDADGTSANNQVTYTLGNFRDRFAIDKYTGEITTLVSFDREAKDSYEVQVIAVDNSPSAELQNGEPNKAVREFRIEIADKNDNPPHFTQAIYKVNSIPENTEINRLVTEVKAVDKDTASLVTYSIVAGNSDDTFYIEEIKGEIKINKKLDYELITTYDLTVKAFDGLYEDYAHVEIFVENVNDNSPVFKDFNRNPQIEEENLVVDCLTIVSAYDPDIKDREANQHIAYFIFKDEHKPFIDIDEFGCMKLKKPLDRDLPNGYAVWPIIVTAKDDDGSPTSRRELVKVEITLEDINDNAPFLDIQQPIVWDERQLPGKITKLRARDYDTDANGPPFNFNIDENADLEIITKFEIRKDDLHSLVEFDREEQKSYEIPIVISDSGKPPMTGTSTLTVIIGDVNDNPMTEGSSSIFVYNYKGKAPDTEIGRVYVNDLDDWDLPDKHFKWESPHADFRLNPNNGMITLRSGTPSKNFLLKFSVTEKSRWVDKHTVNAFVNVTVKEIPEEAVVKSGSIRFHGISAEQFVEPSETGVSRKGKLQERLAMMLNTKIENVDIFTVLHSPHHNNMSLLDVRFSAHGSPYYAKEKLNTIAAQHSKEIEREMNADILIINIDECLFEKVHCNDSCRSFLNASSEPYSVFTNTSSFVGVRAVVDPICTCHVAEPIVCLNGGTPLAKRCECPPGFEGPRCELLGIGFHGDGWAVMPSPGQACDDSHLGLELTTEADSGLIFYLGPLSYNPKLEIRDFMSLEIQQGYPVLYVDYGTGTVSLEHTEIRVTDGKSHRIDVYWTKTTIEMTVDNCGSSACFKIKAPVGTNEFLNVNGLLQIGGAMTNLSELSTNFGWNHEPTDKGFVGCIRNMTINGDTFDLGMPALSRNADPDCQYGIAKAVSFGTDTNFLVAILVCIAIFLILLLVVVVHRKKRGDLYRAIHDVKGNIINYDDEGGGEYDTGYDLSVFRLLTDEPPSDSKSVSGDIQTKVPDLVPDEVPSICSFLNNKKEICDRDLDTSPVDDVRHYAYEGEGNSDGSLSSLASGTDDGDLEFLDLSNFGPRFKKLADIYGDESSGEDSDGVSEGGSESWC